MTTAKKDETQTLDEQAAQGPSLPLATTVDALVQASKDAANPPKNSKKD